MTVPRLDPLEPQKVSYCIPLPLRDAQIRASIARGLPRIQSRSGWRDEPTAIVCYGPSLNETWEKIRDFPVIFTCSGAHQFCTDRLIIPSYHVEVDPRPHKTALIGTPCRETVSLIASTCHPRVFEHLTGYDVRLWHVFDSQEDGIRTLPHGEWALTGGCSVGLRALTVAAFLGFHDLHIFGMDGCEGASGKHAAAHPNQPKGSAECEYPPDSGVIYRTTPAMLSAAQGTFHELDQMPQVRATFYGEGLVQVMARDYVPKPADPKAPFQAMIGMRKGELISAEYVRLNAQLHRERPDYGVGGDRHASLVLQIIRKVPELSKLGTGLRVLDYGCGKGSLARALPMPVWEYDPAIPGKEESPRPADLVTCTDVLEHIEPERLNQVLEDLRRVTRAVGYFVIHTGAAQKTLPDGRNTHLIQRPRSWWELKLAKYFKIGQVFERGPEVTFVVGAKGKPSKQAVEMMQAS
jgi:uncharacterized Rossmann fold enzyme